MLVRGTFPRMILAICSMWLWTKYIGFNPQVKSKCFLQLAFLPFAYVMDSWRWKLFTGDIAPENLNAEWWKLRENLQGTVRIFKINI